MLRVPLLVAFGLLFVSAASVRAQQVSFDNADTDNDGRLSRDEYVEARDRQFGDFDTNGDGVVSSNDFVHMPTRRTSLTKLSRTLRSLDLNGDRVITREELRSGDTPIFDAADADGDGFLNDAEMAALRKIQAKRRRQSL
jgi:Ca2+-binding EF-hand superfamily protein